MKNMNIIILTGVVLLILYKYYDKIPSRSDHINRNKYNIFPVGRLKLIFDNRYIDNNGIITQSI